MVSLKIRKEGSPSRRQNKLMGCEDGSFKVLEWIRDNAYKLKLSSDMNVSVTMQSGWSYPLCGKWLWVFKGKLL